MPKKKRKRPQKGPFLKTRKRIRLVSNGTKAFSFTKGTVIPIALVAFAAAAYWLYDVPVPESRKKKASKALKNAMKDPESQKVYL
ncbi:MAG: hypothetical protein J6Z38_04465 [Lachnospiraceae bacterium]|nr:hypothetical protein [Lachnospiraceae bacterium]